MGKHHSKFNLTNKIQFQQESLGPFFSQLSSEVLEYLLSFLEPRDLCTLMQLNYYLANFLSGEGLIWKTIFCEQSLFYDRRYLKESEQLRDFKKLYQQLEQPWLFDNSKRYCGEAFTVLQNGKSIRVDLRKYKGPVTVQRVLTQKGASRGQHQIKLRVDAFIPPDTAFGLCRDSIPPHGMIDGIVIYAGDGTMNFFPNQKVRKEPRIKMNKINTGDIISFQFNFEEEGQNEKIGVLRILINNQIWAIVDGLSENEDEISTNDLNFGNCSSFMKIDQLSKRRAWHFYVEIKSYACSIHPYKASEIQEYSLID